MMNLVMKGNYKKNIFSKLQDFEVVVLHLQGILYGKSCNQKNTKPMFGIFTQGENSLGTVQEVSGQRPLCGVNDAAYIPVCIH